MKFFIFISILTAGLMGCMQAENSSSLDQQLYDGSSLSAQAKSLFSRYCSACHNYASLSDDQLIASGLIIAGNPTTSKLYYRLSGATSGAGPRNMPTGSAMTASEVALISEWIESL